MAQNQIGNNTTASRPFVTPGGVVYFRGTDNKLWRVNSDGSNQMQVGNNSTKSTPFVTADGWVWFQGTDDKLWKVFNDGSRQSQPGNNSTSSSPTVMGNYVYFCGTDNKLWRVTTDGKQQNVINNNSAKSTPFVTADGWVWFQGTDNKLWKVFNDGSRQSQPGNNSTSSSPTVMGNYVYFRGTDNKLWRMTIDGSQKNVINNNTTKDTPCVTSEGWVLFQGTDNKLWRVFNDGSQQSQLNNTCLSAPTVGQMGFSEGIAGEWTYFQGTDDKLWRLFLPASSIATGTIRPKYYILSVLYSPPGANGGNGDSEVEYATGSSTGTTTSTSSSFKEGASVEASGSVNIDIVKLGGSSQFSASSTTTDTSSQTITKNQNIGITVKGPKADGIDHDHDLFVLMLNPLLGVVVYPGNQMQWTMGIDGPEMNIQYVYVGWLKDPSIMASGVKQELDAAGLTAADYAQILAANPFALGGTTIDPSRFVPTSTTFPYEPPFSANDSVVTTAINTQSSVNVTHTQTVQQQYSVSASVSEGIASFVSLKESGSMEWTNTSTYGASSTSTQSATATVGGPAFGYAGPTNVVVYWDTLYSSFMFAFL